MRSIGIFYQTESVIGKNNNSCPYLIDDQRPNCSKIDNNVSESFTLQINLWNVKVKNNEKGSKDDFKAIDFGVVFSLSIHEIAFLLPFEVNKDDVDDLASVLATDPNLLCAVFNDDIKSTSEPEKSYHKIECSRFKYIMYELSSDNIKDCDYDPESKTTLLRICVNTDFSSDEFKNCKLFIRFRIRMKSLDCFGEQKEISNDWLQSAFSSTYMFDIRINDVREMAKKKKEFVEFHGFQLPKFDKIHFFYMSDSEETVENGSNIELDSRLLENTRWHNYLGNKLEFVSTIIAHHWKKTSSKGQSLFVCPYYKDDKINSFIPRTNGFNNFSLFYKTEFLDPRKKRIALYLAVVVALGLISSAVNSLIALFIPENCQYGWFVWVGIIGIVILSLYYFMSYSKNHTR